MLPIALCVALAAPAVYATERHYKPSAKADARAYGGNATASNKNSNLAVGNGGGGGGGGAGGAASSNNSVSVGGDERSAYAPSLGALASGPCTGTSGQATAAVPGFGIGFGGAKEDEECTARENARIVCTLHSDRQLCISMLERLRGVQDAKRAAAIAAFGQGIERPVMAVAAPGTGHPCKDRATMTSEEWTLYCPGR